MYLVSTCRPDIAFVTAQSSKYMQNPRQIHLDVALRVIRYLRTTENQGIQFNRIDESNDKNSVPKSNMVAYCDASFQLDPDTERSVYGNLSIFYGSAVTWSSQIGKSIPLSTTEAELMSAVEQIKALIFNVD